MSNNGSRLKKSTRKKVIIFLISLALGVVSGFISEKLLDGHNIRLVSDQIISTLKTLESQDNNIRKIVEEKCGIRWDKVEHVAKGESEFEKDEINALVKAFPRQAPNWFDVKENEKFKYFVTTIFSILVFFISSASLWIFLIESPQDVLTEINIEEVMEDRIDEYLTKIMHFKLEDFLGQDLYEKIKIAHIKNLGNHDKLDAIKEFISSGKVGFVFQKKNCEISEYAEWAKKFDQRAKKSIYSTNILKPKDLFSGSHPKKREYVIQHLKEVNESNIDIKSKIRIQILVKEKNDFYNGEQFKKDYWGFFMNENVTFKWCYLDEIKEFFLGDYILYDEMLVLKYDEKTKLLELFSGDIVELYKKVFVDPVNLMSGRESFPPNIK